MHSDFEGIDTHGKRHLAKVEFLAADIVELHSKKEETYKGSWAKRGYIGTFFNVARPWDRIHNAFSGDVAVTPYNVAQRHVFDALVDVALYCLKIAVTLVDHNGELYEGWAMENLGHARDWPTDD